MSTRLASHLAATLLLSSVAACAHTGAPTPAAAPWVVAAESTARTETLTPQDVVLTRSISDVELSPDGKFVAYTMYVPTPLSRKGRSTAQIWRVATRGDEPPERLTRADVSSYSPRWSPDGKSLAFLSHRSDDHGAQVYVLSADGGEARRVTHADASVRAFAWAPDGTSLAYTAAVPTPARKQAREAGRDWIVDEGGGDPARLFVAPLPPADADPEHLPEAREVVKSGAHIIDFAWAPDGKTFAVHASKLPTIDHVMMYSALYTAPAAGGELRPLAPTEGKLGAMAWSPDGKHVAFLGAANLHDSTAGIVYVVPASGGKPRALTADLPATGKWVGWRDRSTVLLLANEGTATSLYALPVGGGAPRRLWAKGPVCADFSHAGGNTAACAGSTPEHPREVFAGALTAAAPRRLTVANPHLANKKLGEQSVVRWTAADGLRLEGILTKPVGYQPGTRYPLAVLPHGGPEGISLHDWRTRSTYPAQIFATAGYVVFEPNYRGSAGRGPAFAAADHQDLGGKEFEDVLAGIDHLVEQGLVDPDRVGMGGWSYGGYFSALAATMHTKRFRAAMIGAAVVDWISFSGTTEIEHENSLVHWNLWPWEHLEKVWERSPMAHIRGSQTAVLVVHGLADTRVPPGQGLEIYRGLEHQKVPAQLVLYPREPHGLRENVHSLDFIQRFVGWFDAHVKAAARKPTPADRPASAD